MQHPSDSLPLDPTVAPAACGEQCILPFDIVDGADGAEQQRVAPWHDASCSQRTVLPITVIVFLLAVLRRVGWDYTTTRESSKPRPATAHVVRDLLKLWSFSQPSVLWLTRWSHEETDWQAAEQLFAELPERMASVPTRSRRTRSDTNATWQNVDLLMFRKHVEGYIDRNQVPLKEVPLFVGTLYRLLTLRRAPELTPLCT